MDRSTSAISKRKNYGVCEQVVLGISNDFAGNDKECWEYRIILQEVAINVENIELHYWN